MTRSTFKILLPLLLLAAGAAALVYGTAVRALPVWATVMVEKEEIILERPPVPIYRTDGPGDRRPPMPGPPPRPKKVKTSKPEEQEQRHGESKLIRDITVGGIERLADGRLKFTYGPGEDGPALCPT
jgi:hypothetical protein